jgi:hypothetical protein
MPGASTRILLRPRNPPAPQCLKGARTVFTVHRLDKCAQGRCPGGSGEIVGMALQQCMQSDRNQGLKKTLKSGDSWKGKTWQNIKHVSLPLHAKQHT